VIYFAIKTKKGGCFLSSRGMPVPSEYAAAWKSVGGGGGKGAYAQEVAKKDPSNLTVRRIKTFLIKFKQK